jgi:hypothetical protein
MRRGETTAGPIVTEGTSPPITRPRVTAIQPRRTREKRKERKAGWEGEMRIFSLI